ncbi:MAG: ASKHA domain-containing protein, partial [Verrucomicrobiales bacterium]|nr:ASKHA domain-containing protein [Verrucomicrobiales bacterium]
TILGDESHFAFTPQEGWGIAIDLGTTTIAAQLLDLQTGHVLAVQTALNAQARHGADIMSRLEFALRHGQSELQGLIREQLGRIVWSLIESARARACAGANKPGVPRAADRTACLKRVVLVGNTVMHHLFCGVPVEPLASFPFEPKQRGRIRFTSNELGWPLPEETAVEFLPCVGGFVGSDILAGIVATGLHTSEELGALMDLGTNGEVVVGNRHRLLCTSTAAGPAFEGARISMGMRAATGAISAVEVQDNFLSCRVIGGGEPRGLCGSGLVDAVAAGLELEWIHPSGRMANRTEMPLAGAVILRASDVRELQLAKAAIAAGLRILTGRLGARLEDLAVLHLAGAFGNYISRASARRIGLLRLPLERIRPAGNTALLGAKRALFEDAAAWDALAARVEHIALNEDPHFQDIFAAEMHFPATAL